MEHISAVVRRALKEVVRTRMSRLEDLRAEIVAREAELATLEAAFGHADDAHADALALAIDQCADELFQLRAEAEDIEGDIAMREAGRNRARHHWRTL